MPKTSLLWNRLLLRPKATIKKDWSVTVPQPKAAQRGQTVEDPPAKRTALLLDEVSQFRRSAHQ